MRKYTGTYHILSMLLLVTVTFASCRPKGILHSWEMRDVIVDLHKTEALLQVTDLNNYNGETKAIYYSQVLQKHGITQAQFDSSLVWYTAHPQLFDKIYPRVLAQLEKEEKDFLEAHPEFLGEFETPEEKRVILQRRFTRADLDSILWVTQHGYDNSWEKWERPFSMHNLVD